MYTPKMENGDVVLDQSGHSEFLTGAAAAKQIVMNAFLLWKSAWFLELNKGIDWLEATKKGYTTSQIIQIIISGLVKNPYITKVIDLTISVDQQTRLATINYIVLMDNQLITGSVTL